MRRKNEKKLRGRLQFAAVLRERQSSQYAAYLAPDLRATASNLSAVVNGVATILLFVLVDPWLAVLTGDVVEGRASDAQFRWSVVAPNGCLKFRIRDYDCVCVSGRK